MRRQVKISKELSMLLRDQARAEKKFKARVAKGSKKIALTLLDKLDKHFLKKV